jgi:nucleotide-binding universal stress UspA family protein
MTPLSTVLCATDLSGPSLRAVDRGLRIAHESGAACVVAHAMGFDPMRPIQALLGARGEELAHRAIERQRAALERLLGDPTRSRGTAAQVRVEPGLPAEVVPALAVTLDADLVVAGAHGHGFVQRVLLGSTSSSLLRKSPCPVLVVKEPARSAYRRMLVAVDFSPGSVATVRWARRLAPGAALTLLHVFDVPFEGMLHLAGLPDDVVERYRIDERARSLQRMRELATEAQLGPGDHTSVVLHGNATRTILSEARRHGCDLVVMGKHGTHVTEDLLLGSVTQRVLAESTHDVLVVVDRRRREESTVTGGTAATPQPDQALGIR